MNEASKNKWIAVIISMVVVAMFFGGVIFYQNNQKVDTSVEGIRANQGASMQSAFSIEGGMIDGKADSSINNDTSLSPSPMNTTTTPEGLVITDIAIGNGAEAKAGQTIAAHYSGTLENGTKFDSSYDRGQPLVFTLGVGQVIKGWDQGIVGMRVGGKRKLVIPAALAYGNRAVGDIIPANSTLIFEVELEGIQ